MRLMLLLVCTVGLSGQTAPQFEVASIKLTKSAESGSVIHKLPGGRFQGDRVTLRFLIVYAWNVADYQLMGGPKWLDSDRFDVVATPEQNAGNEPVSRDASVRRMLQTLLAERFGLKVHTERREMQAIVLTAAKGGSKLPPTTHPPGPQVLSGREGLNKTLTFQAAPLSYVVKSLSNQLQNVVVDETGFTGTYDFKLAWTPNAVAEQDTTGQAGPTLTAALEDLGIRLIHRKASAEVLVIDTVDKPSEN